MNEVLASAGGQRFLSPGMFTLYVGRERLDVGCVVGQRKRVRHRGVSPISERWVAFRQALERGAPWAVCIVARVARITV